MPRSALTLDDDEPAANDRVSAEDEIPSSALTRDDDEPGEEG
jgi:hypothetical protein